MNLTEYQEAVNKTWIKAEGITELEHCFVGIIEEVGEITGWYKKHLFYGLPMSDVETQLKGEFGDLLYYIVKLGELTNQIDNVEYYFEDMAVNEESDLTTVGVLIDMTGNINKLTHSGLYSDEFKLEYEELMICLCILLARERHTLADIMESNVAKLKSRHGVSFNLDKAHPADRDLLKEDKAVACDTAVQLGLDLQVRDEFLPETYNYTAIGARVRLSRMIKGIKQYQLADNTTINRSALSNIETGKLLNDRHLLTYLSMIAKHLQIDVDYLLNGK